MFPIYWSFKSSKPDSKWIHSTVTLIFDDGFRTVLWKHPGATGDQLLSSNDKK